MQIKKIKTKIEKPVKYSKDNPLGWSEKEFRNTICTMCNIQISQNRQLHPTLSKYYSQEADQWHKDCLDEEYRQQCIVADKNIEELKLDIESDILLSKQIEEQKFYLTLEQLLKCDELQRCCKTLKRASKELFSQSALRIKNYIIDCITKNKETH